MTLADRVRYLRERLEPRVSQLELSRRIGAEPGYVAAVERGRIKVPNGVVLRRIAQELHTSAADLLHAAGYLPDVELQELSGGVDDPGYALALRQAAQVENEHLRRMVMGVIEQVRRLEEAEERREREGAGGESR